MYANKFENLKKMNKFQWDINYVNWLKKVEKLINKKKTI